MNAEIYQALSAYAGLTALVGGQVYHHRLPDNFDISLPYVIFLMVSNPPLNSINGENATQKARIQFDCVAPTAGAVEEIYTAVKTAVTTATTFSAERINRFDQPVPELNAYRITTDFTIWL
jgi:hypothetical protein